jgi:hypothetical protein
MRHSDNGGITLARSHPPSLSHSAPIEEVIQRPADLNFPPTLFTSSSSILIPADSFRQLLESSDTCRPAACTYDRFHGFTFASTPPGIFRRRAGR